MKKLIQLALLALFTLFVFQCSDDDTIIPQPEAEPETIVDADGNIYETIEMGNQIWMLENLKTTKYNDGTPITQYTFDVHGINWAATGSQFNSVGFYQWPDTSDLNDVVDEELAFDAYGAMYNYFALESGKLAPEGWRIPTEADFIALENFLSNDGNAGNEATVLKSTTGWLSSVENGTDLYGFNALPNGYINGFGGPTFANGVCTWATSDIIDPGLGVSALQRKTVQLMDNGAIAYFNNPMQIGAGVRCIKIQ